MIAPTSDQLQRLTFRAIAAYAARGARRASPVIRGVLPDEVIEAPLREMERVASHPKIEELSPTPSARAARRVAQELMALHPGRERLAALCLMGSVIIVHAILLGRGRGDKVARRWAAQAARQAANIADRSARALDDPSANDAAARDYQILASEFGEHETPVTGEPVDLSETWWRERGSE